MAKVLSGDACWKPYFVKYHLLCLANEYVLLYTQTRSTFPCDTPHAVLHWVALWQHLDYKMLDQRPAKRWDFGMFTGQMAAPLLSLSCHWATTGRSLEAEAYAIQHAQSAVQLVAWKNSSEAKHRKWQNTCRQKFEEICITLRTCVFDHLQLHISSLAS